MRGRCLFTNVTPLPSQASLHSCKAQLESASNSMHAVGQFLEVLFHNHSLHKRQETGVDRSRSVTRLSISLDTSQLLHFCPGYNQEQLIRLMVSICDGIPEAFEVFQCRPTSTEEELSLFLKKAAKHPRQYLMMEVNRLPFKLQEVRIMMCSILVF